MALVFVVAVAALGLLSAGQAAPLSDCQHLTQQIDIQGRDQLFGKWYYQGESSNLTGSTVLIKKIISSLAVTMTAAEESNTVNILQNQKMLNRCISVKAKSVLANNSLTLIYYLPATEVLLSTSCPDCLAVYTSYSLGSSRRYKSLKLLSKRTRVTDAEVEEFKKQVECLNLPPPAIMRLDKADFCPDVPDEEALELTSISSNITQQLNQAFEQTVNSEGGVKRLLDLVSSHITPPEQQ